MKTCATIFSGGGGFEVGARAAGLTPIWGVEYDAEIAGVYAQNFGPHCIVSRAEDVNYSSLTVPFWLHMSPVCKNASVAKKDGQEAAEDIAMAEACARAIRQLQAPQLSLENVWGYRNFSSFRTILCAIHESGYAFDYWHLNAADYGVPQTRKRLILLASKTHRPRQPIQTHAERGPAQNGLFGDIALPAWRGWYGAIEDLIPTLPESKFAEWQLKRLPNLYRSTLVTHQYNNDSSYTETRGPAQVEADSPAPPVLATQANRVRAFLFAGDNAGSNGGRGTVRDAGEPMVTIQTRPLSQCTHKAFIVEATAAGADNKFTMPVRDGADPVFTVRPGPNIPRAFIVSPMDATLWPGNEPAPAVMSTTHSKGQKPRAWLSHGRVVSMTPRALARFQSFPDSYKLPSKNGLACKVIGNAVACLLAQRFIESELMLRERAA